ncbi:unnamed protein product [Durusdinium trenchii]|uniref:CCHC-type domain-containing protein n=1 Tax=Durusdinium trenchii TaxID=1381693 RepID=A0ABP0PGS7_9DINO
MATWCHQVREAYRKLQRALRRARGDQPDPKDDGAAPSHASSRARSGPEPAAEDDSEEEQDQDEEPGRPPSRPASSPKSRGKGKTKDHASPSRGSRGSGGSSSEDEDFSTLWDDLDLGLPEVLPTELIGWIMLRKSALNAAQRLNVLSSIGNSLKAEDVERGLRGAEDELRLVEREREGRPKGHSKGKHRNTFWIEQDDQWGILLTEEADAEDILEQNDVHWLSTNALEQAFPAWETPSTPSSRPDTEDRYGQEDGFFAADPQLPGAYESEAWNSVLWSSPDEAKPVVEAYAAYEEKMRTFQDSRRAHAAKQASRGFFPKGKWKGKGHGKKGKGYARPTFSSSSTASPVLAVHGAGKPGSPSYSGCFICGAKDHDFRSCPKRSKSGKGFGSGKVFMVEEAQELEETFVFHAWSEPERPLSVMKVGEVSSPEMEGFGVLDTGATETVCGLSALEWIMHKRAAAGASSGDFTVVDVPQKTFKFGNGMTQQSESLILLPQRLGEHSLSLGIYTLEANGVPVLVGIKTLTRLGAIRDTSRSAMVLTAIDASLLVPLKLSGSGHLLMDLAHDWLSQGTKILFTEELSGKQQYAKAKAKIEEPSKSSGKGDKMDKKKATWEEKYDESRTVAADPRDPRTLRAPCWGNHTPAAAYRGSVSGSNGHATWVGCERCQLRLSYTPAFGATGLHRQAGPIPEDTRRQVEELKEKAPYNPLLRTQAVGLDGAERSLMSKLDNIRARKAAAGYAPRSPDSNETTAPSSNQTPVPRTPSSVVEIPDDEEEYVPSPAPTDKELLSMVPGSKSRRNERPAEEVEYADREDRSWSTVTSPEKRTGASS